MVTCDVAVIGGGLGGVAAAMAAADAGASVVLTERTDWIGGQVTSQGVAALDEHEHIETVGATRTYGGFRERVRDRYREEHGGPDRMPDGDPLNPGNCWVSRLGFEPRVGKRVLETMLDERDGIRIHREHEPVDATVEDGRVTGVTLDGDAGRLTVAADYYLDATELGALLPLTGTAYVTGAEARDDTGEAHARAAGPAPEETQAFTYCFAVEHRPGEDHTIERPEGYADFREAYTFEYERGDGTVAQYRMFEEGPNGERPFWTYRRLFDPSIFDDPGRERDVALINWSGNDYRRRTLLDQPPEERAAIRDEAKRQALGFLHWLQTEAPRDDGGRGYPGLRLLPEVMGTDDGLSKRPYHREARRIVPERRVVEGDVAAHATRGARARPFPDTVGIGWYPIDVHACVGTPDHHFAPTRPFRVPLGALLPADGPANLLAAAKNVGTTHLTNGCYRLHPVEWAIGEAAGALAGGCDARGTSPAAVRDDRRRLRRFQYRLVDRGVPIAWTLDVPPDHDLFVPAQLLAAAGGLPDAGRRFEELDVRPDDPVTNRDLLALLFAGAELLGRDATLPARTDRDATAARATAVDGLDALGVDGDPGAPPTWGGVASTLAPAIRRALR